MADRGKLLVPVVYSYYRSISESPFRYLHLKLMGMRLLSSGWVRVPVLEQTTVTMRSGRGFAREAHMGEEVKLRIYSY